MSTNKSVENVIKEIEYWLRLTIFLHEPLKESLLYVLHNESGSPDYVGLPKDPNDLYQELKNRKWEIIQNLHRKGILNQKQIELLQPCGDNKTFSDKFDVTLIIVLIRSCTTLNPPLSGWSDKNPPAFDVSVATFVVRAREWRNEVIHYGTPKNMDVLIFNDKWRKGVEIVDGLGYTYDAENLKTVSLDPKNSLVSDSLVTCMESLKKKQDENGTAINQLQGTNDEILRHLSIILKDIRRKTNPITIEGNQH